MEHSPGVILGPQQMETLLWEPCEQEDRIQAAKNLKQRGSVRDHEGRERGQGRRELIRLSGLRPGEIKTEPAPDTSIQDNTLIQCPALLGR